jgi:hypothetical protein
MVMTEPIKLCKDCKHYKRDWNARITGFGDTFDLCLHPALTGNVVTGRSNGKYCDHARKYYECGMEGKYWEARK